MKYVLDTSLNERETYLLGSIVSQWGYLEADIFEQTLQALADVEPLPKEMNNAKFSLVLDLWLREVAEKQVGERRAVLITQYERIRELSQFRQAVVHSRWEWNPEKPDEVVAVRVIKKEIIRAKFTVQDLADMAGRVGEIRYLIRYPGGLEDRAKEMAETGFFVSRGGWERLFGGSGSVEDEMS
ncbi:hypothetical protein PCC82_08165 [Agrobacterium deltaense]